MQLIDTKSPWSSTPLYPSGCNEVWANILLVAGGLKLKTDFWISFKIYTFPLAFIPSYPLSHFSFPEPHRQSESKAGGGGEGRGKPWKAQTKLQEQPTAIEFQRFSFF